MASVLRGEKGTLKAHSIRTSSATLLLSLVAAVSIHAQSSTTVYSAFANATEPGWTLTGAAHLTSGLEDPSGNGWLRLTDNKRDQASFVFYNNPFPLGSGFRVVFNYAFWGQGNNPPADGITFALFDAAITTPGPGAFGGSLGYAQKTGIPGLPAVTAVPAAVLGIGLDSYGNFSNPTEGRTGGPGFVPFTVTIRGPGNGTANLTNGSGKPNYGFLATSGQIAQSLLDLGNTATRPQSPADFRQATITVDTSQISLGHVPTTVDIVQGNNASVRIITADLYPQILDFYGSPANFPTNVKFGFTGGTGGFVDYHDIRFVTAEITNIPGPDLVISKTHSGNFQRGTTGVYSISVRNRGQQSTSGTVTITDVVPAGLVATGASGTGWSCSLLALPNVTCSRADPLATSANYPNINLQVSVNSDAPSSVANPVSIAGGGDIDLTNNTASDPTSIVGGPDLMITKSHTGNFFQGQKGVTFTLTVRNIGTLATNGPVTVQDFLPLGLAPVSLAGTGWNCPPSGTACNRADALSPNGSYPPITVTADVDPNSLLSLTNQVEVSGGNDQNSTNNHANDPVIIAPGPNLRVVKSHTGDFVQGQQNAEYRIVVTNIGGTPTVGEVQVFDIPPSDLQVVSATGTGWNCVIRLDGAGCSRSDPLPATQSYPPILVLVHVKNSALPLVVNSSAVAGGGDTDNTNNHGEDPTNILPSPDLAITKTHTASFIAGQQQAYTITVSNVGNANTRGLITVTDTVPAELQPVSASGNGWSCSIALQAMTCTRSDALAPNAAFPTITLNVNVPVSVPPSVTNVANVSGGADQTPGNNTATDVTTIGPGADLVIAKTGAATLTQGGTGTYQLVVSNTGIAATTGLVTVDDPLTPVLTLAAPPRGNGWICNATGPVHCERSDVLNPGASYPAIAVTVNISPSAPGIVTNTVTVAAGVDVNPLNNTDTAIANVASGADLTIDKTHTGNFVQGQTGIFTITVSNVGTAPTNNLVTVIDRVSLGLTPIAATGAGWTCQISATVSCSRSDSLAVGAAYPPIILSIQVGLDANSTVLKFGEAANLCEVIGGNDNNPSNNADSDTVLIAKGPDLIITKVHAGSLVQGGTGSYTLTVTNRGEAPSQGQVFVADSVPRFLSVTSAGGPGWTCSVQPQTVTCSRADVLSAGSSYPPVTIAINVSSSAQSQIVNTASASGGGDVDLSNNTGVDTTAIGAGPDLSISKTHQGSFTPGGTGTFSLTVSNIGGSATSGLVTVTDNVPARLSPVSATGAGWACSVQGQSVTCSRSDALAAGASYPAIALTVNIAADVSQAVTNTAAATGGGDTRTDNNTAQDTVIFGGGGGPFRCVTSAVPPVIRREGLSELVGDIILTCTGGTPTAANAPVPKTNLQIFLNTNITSRMGSASIFSEALLLLDDPWPTPGSEVPANTSRPAAAGTQRLCNSFQNTLGNGRGVGIHDGSSPDRCNVFIGQQAGPNSIVFTGVPIDPPGAGARVIRITNVRSNASQLGSPMTPVPSQVIAFISASPQSSLPITNSQLTVAFVTQGLFASTADVINLQQCLSVNPDLTNSQTSGISRFSITVREGFPTAFNRRNFAVSADGNTSPAPVAQNIPGFQYHSETGFYNPLLLSSVGLADFGTRIVVRFENVGAGVSLFVPTVVPLKFAAASSAVSGSLRLLSTSVTASSPFAVAVANVTLDGAPAAQLPVADGVGVAIYEVLNSNESTTDMASIPVGISYIANPASKLPATGLTSVRVTFAPLSTVGTADPVAPIPRFTGAPDASPFFAINSCACNLLFPFVTNQIGFDTGIAIANTSQDPFGSPPQAGTVTLTYYGNASGGAPAPAAQVSQTVPAGRTLTFNLSGGGSYGVVGTPGFQGYIIAQADFQYCHGLAFISDIGSNQFAEGYKALVLDDPSAHRTGKSSESLRQ